MDLLIELGGIAAVLEERNIPYALAGGLAFSILVQLRATEDIDLLVRAEDWPDIEKAFAKLGYEDMTGEIAFHALTLRRLTKIVGTDHTVVDFLLATPALAAGIERALIHPFGAGRLRVLRPEDLIALKKLRNSAQDKADIEALERQLAGEKP